MVSCRLLCSKADTCPTLRAYERLLSLTLALEALSGTAKPRLATVGYNITVIGTTPLTGQEMQTLIIQAIFYQPTTPLTFTKGNSKIIVEPIIEIVGDEPQHGPARQTDDRRPDFYAAPEGIIPKEEYSFIPSWLLRAFPPLSRLFGHRPVDRHTGHNTYERDYNPGAAHAASKSTAQG